MNEKTLFKTKRITAKIVLYTLLIAVAVILMLPFVWTFFASVKTEAENIAVNFALLPEGSIRDWNWSNYAVAIEMMDFWNAFKNTLTITLGKLFGDVFVSALVAYGFARFDFPFKRVLFLIVLASLMIPFEIIMIPLYTIYAQIGWINTFLPIIVPAMFGAVQFIFFLTMYFMTMPKDLVSAAQVDGYTDFEIFRKIYLPIATPALIVVGIWSVQASWNDLLGPLIWLQDSSKFTLQLALSSLTSSTTYYHVDQGVIMAGTILVILPFIILFLFLQKYLLDSTKTSGIKG